MIENPPEGRKFLLLWEDYGRKSVQRAEFFGILVLSLVWWWWGGGGSGKVKELGSVPGKVKELSPMFPTSDLGM